MSHEQRNKARHTKMRSVLTILVAMLVALSGVLAPTEAHASSSRQRAQARALIVQGIRARKENISVKEARITERELEDIYFDVKFTHGEFWYLKNDYYWCCDHGKADIVSPCYRYRTKGQYKSMKKRYDAALGKAVRYVKRRKSQKMRALAAHDYLMRHCSYDYRDRDCTTSAYSALVSKSALCEGYAKAYQQILAKVGIPCKIIYTEDHEWNLVKIGGSWYHVDVTYDDTTGSHKYFLKSTRWLRSHERDLFPNSGGASCRNTKFDSVRNWKLK